MDAVVGVGVKQAEKLKFNQSVIAGRIESCSSFDVKGKRVHEAVVTTPAADVYSMPGFVPVQSSYKLGGIGDEVTVHVTVSGIRNSWVDKITGELKKSANARFSVVE